VRFVNDTLKAFGPQSSRYHGPIGILDYDHDGRNSLFVMEQSGFQLLNNSNGHFAPLGTAIPAANTTAYRQCLVGDLNNDRYEDVIILGEQASHVFRFGTNGQFRDFTSACGLKDLRASEGLLADLDITGCLGARAFVSIGTLAVFISRTILIPVCPGRRLAWRTWRSTISGMKTCRIFF
jgi:hypothetical protein